MRPINNIFIFSFIQSATGQKKFAPIFRALHLEATGSGRRFKEGLYGNCWWPKHPDWYGHLWSEDSTLCIVANQEFPLQIISKDSRTMLDKLDVAEAKISGIKTDDAVGSKTLIEEQWTFESCLFDYLMEVFRSVYHNDFPAILYALAVHGKEHGLSNNDLNIIASQPDERSLARFLIMQAKSVAGLPLEIPEETTNAVRHSEDLYSDDVELYTYFDLQTKYTALEISEQLIRNDKALFPQETLVAHGGDAKMWRDHIVANPENWMFLCNRTTKKIVGNWSFAFITPEQEEDQVQTGVFMEGEFTIGKRQDVFSTAPNRVSIYLLNLSTNDRTENSRLMLWRSFAERIQALAQKGVFIKGVYTNALDAEQESVFARKGFKHVVHNSGGGEIYFLDLSCGFPEEFSYIVQNRDLETLCYKYWRSKFECRQLTNEDNLSEQQEKDLARLIWETDPYIYPSMFTERQAEELLPLLFDDDTMFNLRNLYCGFIGDTIIGIILHHKGPLYWTADLLKEESKNLPDTLDIVERDYFTEYQKTPPHTRSIINCCIDSRWRMSGIRFGSEMMKQFLAEHPGEEMELFVLEETPAARKLYRRAGFRKVYDCDGFAVSEKKPPCLFMRRPASK